MPYLVTLESTLKEDWGRTCHILVVGIRSAVDQALEQGADEARQTHRYTDRTGDLTRSIDDRLTAVDALGAKGVIEAKSPYASFVENGTRPHEIRARRARMLAWEEPQGDWHFARVVQHPGTKPFPFMGQAYLKAERVLEAQIGVAIAAAQSAFR